MDLEQQLKELKIQADLLNTRIKRLEDLIYQKRIEDNQRKEERIEKNNSNEEDFLPPNYLIDYSW